MTLPRPRPTNETYIDFLKRKLEGRNVSPEFRQRYPALFDSVQQTTSEPVANWETYYRQAKPKTSIQNNNDGMGNTDGLFNPNDLSREYLDSFIADVQNAPQNIARGFERGLNEITTGFPDYVSNESIEAEIAANRAAGKSWSDNYIDKWNNNFFTPGSRDDRDQNWAANIYTPDEWGITDKQKADYQNYKENYSPGLFDHTDGRMKGEFQKSKWSGELSPAARAGLELDRMNEQKGLFSGLGPFGEKLDRAIQEEVLNPIKSGVNEVTSFFDDPEKYTEEKIANMNTSTLVSKGAGMIGKYGAGLLGLGTIPATMAGYGIGKIAEMMMSEGGGQLGMPGIIADDYWNPGGSSLGPSTVSSIHGFAQTGDGIFAVDNRGNILAELNTNDPTRHGLLLRGLTTTDAGQIAFDEREGGGYVDSPVKGQGSNLFDASTHSLDKGDGYDPNDDGHGAAAHGEGVTGEDDPL